MYSITVMFLFFAMYPPG